MPIETVTATKKFINIKEHYSLERLRPVFKSFEMKPLFLMTSEMA
jgi:6-phosphofructokinase 1